MKTVSHFILALWSVCLISCLPAPRLENSLWDDIEKGDSTIVLATTVRADGKWTYQFTSFIKNERGISAKSAQESLALLNRPAGKLKLSKQAVILIHDSTGATGAISAYYVSDESGWLNVDNGFVELSYIVKRTGP